MAEDLSGQDRLAVAVSRLRLVHTYQRSGESSVWHFPFDTPPKNTTLTATVGPLACVVLSTVGSLEDFQKKNPQDLFHIAGEVTFAKVCLLGPNLSVVSEIPVNEINEKALMAAIGSVLDAVSRIRALASITV